MKTITFKKLNNKTITFLILLGIAMIVFWIALHWQLYLPKTLFSNIIASKTFGGSNDDFARNIIKTNDGGFLVVGETLITENNCRDIWIKKLDFNLTIQWQKIIGGSADDEVRNVIETKDGNYAIVGSTQSKSKKSPRDYDNYDYWFIKINPHGNILWQRCFGGSLEERAFDAIQVKNGGYMIAGYTYSDDGDVKEKFIGKDVWLVRIDEDGQLLWQRKLGGIDNEAFKIIQTSDDGFLMVGYTPGAESVLDDDGASEHDALVVKFNRFGKIEWLETLGGSNEDQAKSVIETSKHEYLIAGFTRSKNGVIKRNHGSSDFWVMKFNQKGKLLWNKTYGGSNSDIATSLIEIDKNQYLIAGETRSKNGHVKGNHGGVDAWVIKISSRGRLLFQNCFGGIHDDVATSITRAGKREYILSGWTDSTDGDIQNRRGKNDDWILKFID